MLVIFVCAHMYAVCVCDTICAYSEAGVDMVLDRCHSSARRSLASCAAGACAGVESKFLVDFSGKFGNNCENLGNSMEI